MKTHKTNLFITGSSGFIATNLISRLNPGDYNHIYCLSRSEGQIADYLSKYPNLTFIKGGLDDNDRYGSYLEKADVVVHLAAATGKVPYKEYFDINVRGTENLIEKCKVCGVKKFIFISSIAVKFDDISKYPYALSKKEAEEALKKSGLNYVILRPTIVLGKDSSIWNSLAGLAKGRIIPLFGNGKAKIQPIYVDDLNDCIISTIKNDSQSNVTFELGGPERISIEGFIEQIHNSLGGNLPRVIHIPLGLLLPVLSFLEKVAFPLVPFTVGQLSSFRFDSTIEMNDLYHEYSAGMKDVKNIIRCILDQQAENKYLNDLIDECAVFSRYLTDKHADDYVFKKYVDGHRQRRSDLHSDSGFFDQLLIYLARMSPLLSRFADVYASIFYKQSLLRKKLVLLLSILESHSAYFNSLDTANESGNPSLILQLFQNGLVFFGLIALSSVILGPLQIGSAIVSKRSDLG